MRLKEAYQPLVMAAMQMNTMTLLLMKLSLYSMTWLQEKQLKQWLFTAYFIYFSIFK